MAGALPVRKVDVDIQQLVVDAARARLRLINTKEQQERGKDVTRMADVARTILMKWSPPEGQEVPDDVEKKGPRKGYRVPGEITRVTKPIRFTITESIYASQVRKMRNAYTTPTRVLEEGLEAFARTGQY